MNPELTIQSMFNRNPFFFGTRNKCLDYLFLKSKSPFHWINGELIADIDINTDERELEQSLVNGKAYRSEPDITSNGKLFLSLSDPYEEDDDNPIINSESRTLSWTTFSETASIKTPPTSWSNVSLNADGDYVTINRSILNLFNIPNNITPEWQSLANECIEALKQDGVKGS